MSATSDNDADFQLGRRHTPSSSRESSPAPKRPRHSFTPTSDDGDLVIPVVHEDAETPTPEHLPLIRQAVGFSWTPSVNANISTYQATVVSQPPVRHFLPGQAPPKPKPSRPTRPRKKKGEQYSGQTGKFRLSGPTSSSSFTSPSTGNSSGTSSSSHAAPSTASSHPMIPAATYTFVHADGNATAASSNTNGTTTSVPSLASSSGATRTKKASKRNVSALLNDASSQPSARPRPAQTAPVSASVTPDPGGSLAEGPGQFHGSQRTRAVSSGTTVGPTNGSMAISQAPVQGAPRPLRMVTLLIEDTRSGVRDSQLAEVKVPLKAADDPEDGFWADAVEICNALQGGPSRIDGPAKVYTMRGKFRQFFMRVDRSDQFQAQSAHLGVSTERTLNVYVEAPAPQGHLPGRPVLPTDVRPVHNSSSERDSMSPTGTMSSRPTYSFPTREDQVERLSKSNYIRCERGRASPPPIYVQSQSTPSPNARHQSLRHGHDHYSIRRPSTPPIPGRMADTQEEMDEAIANYIRSQIENRPEWIDYMRSKARPQRVSEVLEQCTFVDNTVRQLVGCKTPPRWDGAPSRHVEKQHVWRVLQVDPAWGEKCEEMMNFVGFYGKKGSRYEDSRVVGMIDDVSPPKPNAIDRFLCLLRDVDDDFAMDTFNGNLMATPGQD